MRVAKVEEHHTLNQIDELLKRYRTDAEVYVRLLYIRGLKCGLKSKDIAEVLNKSPQICSKWLKNYNEMGLEGITSIVYYQINFHKNSSTQFSVKDSLQAFL